MNRFVITRKMRILNCLNKRIILLTKYPQVLQSNYLIGNLLRRDNGGEQAL